jgi:arylsulfate sulfotransferase
MNNCMLLSLSTILTFIGHFAQATQADDTSITIAGQTPGVTPFIAQIELNASDTSVLKSIQFAIAPKPGSVTRPLSATYSSDYLLSHGYLQPATDEIFLPVFGLYDGYTNDVTLTYYFLDGSSKADTTMVTTTTYDDPCGYNSPTVLQPRTTSTDLSYDYIMVKGRCSDASPAIIDTDSALRWIGTAGISDISSTLFDNAVYQAANHFLYRLDLDGTVTLLHDYSDIGVTYFHHNIDRGKVGLILDANTAEYYESTNIEVDSLGNVLHVWDLAAIISAAMVAGGDDPSQFVYPLPADWFHNNAVTYNRADDSLVISSRENFVICLDYETGAIKWILGDPTKKWYQFTSLRQYALTLTPGTHPPIGQHAVSVSYDQNLLLFDNGYWSWLEMPRGENRNYSSPRKYQLDLNANTATEIWNYEMDQDVYSNICSSVYEDAVLNYLVTYSYVGSGIDIHAQLLGLDAAGERIFYYQYPPVLYCGTAFNAIPLHLENTKFPAVGPRALNLSTRGTISGGENALIGGFIVTGTDSKKVVLRALGPSLSNSGVQGTLADPQLSLYDAAGSLLVTNDDWGSDAAAAELTAGGLAPSSTTEAATVQILAPGAYTVLASGKEGASGIGLVEIYDLTPSADSRLANISTRGSVANGDDVLIGGFILGDVENATVVIRALGPSLVGAVTDSLSDPTITIYDSNGSVIANNDNWRNDPGGVDIEKNQLAPTNDLEAATILHPPPGAYSAIVRGSNGGTGIGLLEIYDLD